MWWYTFSAEDVHNIQAALASISTKQIILQSVHFQEKLRKIWFGSLQCVYTLHFMTYLNLCLMKGIHSVKTFLISLPPPQKKTSLDSHMCVCVGWCGVHRNSLFSWAVERTNRLQLLLHRDCHGFSAAVAADVGCCWVQNLIHREPLDLLHPGKKGSAKVDWTQGHTVKLTLLVPLHTRCIMCIS